MRRLLLFISFAWISAALSAQQIPNGSFTYWSSYFNPDGWSTWASVLGNFNGVVADSAADFAVRDTSAGDYPNDSAALRLTVDTITLPANGLDTLIGFASLGAADYIPPPAGYGLQFGYYQYTLLPDTFFCDYKYIPAAGYNDTAAVVMILTRFDSASQSRVYVMATTMLLDTTSVWIKNKTFQLSQLYDTLVTGIPDTMQLIILASISAHPHPGSTLWIDTVRFDAAVNPFNGIADVRAGDGVYTYPNPANDILHIATSQRQVGSAIELRDMNGCKVYSGTIDQASYVIDTGPLSDGVYGITVHSTDRLTTFRGKVTICH